MDDKNCFRNETWDGTIADHFFKKLGRARGKAQYLKIQARCIAKSYPETAHLLLNRYFEFPVDIFRSQAFTIRAEAYVAQGKIAEAISSYEDALAREAEFPHSLTHAYLDLPLLIVNQSLADKYQRAVVILMMSKKRLTFPVEHFLWNAINATIAKQSLQLGESREFALCAMQAAHVQHSGFRYHPDVGLVSDKYSDLLERVISLVHGR
ncbi:MAG: hypothetical protein WBK91_05965 [Alphaproteobacteria bacterium]